MSEPRKLFSFSDWTTHHPREQPPGDRLDAQFNEHAAAIGELANRIETLLRSDGLLRNGLVTRETLAVDLADDISSAFRRNVAAELDSARGSSLAAQAAAAAASAAEARAAAAAATASEVAELVDAGKDGVVARLEQLQISAQGTATFVANQYSAVLATQATVKADTGESQAWAVASMQWAEYMSGPLPADTIAWMGITGSHWSAAWWAAQANTLVGSITDDASQASSAAAAAATSAADAATAAGQVEASWDQFNDIYLGTFAAPPTLDNDGNALQVGALYYNSSLLTMRVWNGTTWDPFTGSTAVVASDIGAINNAPQGIAGTNVQAYLDELALERLRDAPSDGVTYARRDGAWIASGGAVTWVEITGKPTTFPPSAHVHPISDVTGLQPALDAKATTSALTTEGITRGNADTALQGNIDAEASTRSSADSTLQGNINAETTARQNADTGLQNNINAKLSDAPSDGKQYARKDGAWSSVVGGALVGDVPPTGAPPNSLWWESDTGVLNLRYDDGNSQQWVQVNAVPSTADFLSRSGDTVTGQLLLPTPGTGPAAAPKSYVDSGDAAVAAGVPAQVTSGANTAIVAAQQAVPSVLAHRLGSGTVALAANTIVKIPMVIMVGPVGAWSINGSGGLVCPKKGVYLISGSCSIVTTAATNTMDAGFQLNAGAVFAGVTRLYQSAAVAFQWSLPFTRLQFLDVGDVIYLAARASVACTAGDAIEYTALSAAMITAVP